MTLNEHLEAIRQRYGRLSPQVVVDDARDPGHALHHRFEWDDEVAGEAYRRVQAAALIRSVRVVYRDDETGSYSVRAFIAQRPESEKEADPETDYTPVGEVVADPVRAELLLRQCQREAIAFRRKWQHLKEFTQIVTTSLIDEEGAA